ncbi:MAG: hypothetical protein AAF490_03860 [Chloroflexota bacterium]
MGSQKPYQVVFVIVLLLFFASAGRTFAQDENPPAEPTGLLGSSPSEPAIPTVGAPPAEVPDSTPVIEHPPENESQPGTVTHGEQPETSTTTDTVDEPISTSTPAENVSERSYLASSAEKQPVILSQQQNVTVNKMDFIR